jgi:superfamily II DNA or RNA helicase
MIVAYPPGDVHSPPPISLRDYQSEALDAVRSAWMRGIRRQAISLPTGTGKTVVFAELIRRRRPGRALVLAHRDELITQAADKLAMVAPDLTVGTVKAGQNDVGAPVVVASVQTVCRPRRLDQLADAGEFDTVVVDEAHHAAAGSYHFVLERLVRPNTLLLGVSATLKRGDGAGLADLFQEVVYEQDILTMIRSRYLSDIRGIQVRLAVDFNRLHTRAGDFVDAEVEEALEDANAPGVAVQAYNEHAAGRRTIIFTPTVKAAESFSDAFNAAGIPAALVHGKQSTDERRETLARFHRGELQVIANCSVLTEGFDEPAVSCIIIARPTKSQPLFVQMVGRGTRLYPGKQDLLVLDLVGATGRHDLMTVADLFGVAAEAIESQTVTAAIAAQEEEGQAVNEAARIVAFEVDLFRRRPFHWGATAAGVYTLSTTDGVLLVREVPDGWAVDLVSRDTRHHLASGLDLGYAQGFAEDYARRSGSGALIAPDAPWRSRPPSEKQAAALRRMGVNRVVSTAGEASDLIAAKVAGLAVRR